MPYSNLQDSKTKAHRLVELGMQFVENQKSLIKLSVAEVVVKSAGKIFSILTILFFSFFIVVFLSFSIAFWLGHLLGSLSLGFLCIALIYFLILMICLFYFKQKLVDSISDNILKAIDDEDEF